MLSALQKRKIKTVILSTEMGFAPGTQYFVTPQTAFLAKGMQVILLPGDSKSSAQNLWIRGAELVRAGISREKIIHALTWAPAKLLGVEKKAGAIEEKRAANFLHFSRDPFSAAARIEHVYYEGHPVKRALFQGEKREQEDQKDGESDQ
jgi:imidazolonepropionase-like amidohydrolase